MVSSSGLIEMIAKKLKEYKAENIVVDPVMVATSGARLISEDAIETLKKELLPLATLIETAKKISENFGCATLVKGIKSIMRMIYCLETIHMLGLKGNVSIIQIHMVRAVLCRAQ